MAKSPVALLSILTILCSASPLAAQEKAITVTSESQITGKTPITQTPGGTEVRLKPGKYVWQPELSPKGPVVIVISLPDQLAYVYRNGIAIGVSTVSSGKKGHETPTGVFTILQKNREHYSNLYNNAPMPNMQRLTWTGIALHAGRLPGYPASHGCIRLPLEFSKKVFGATGMGTTVVVSGKTSAPSELVYAGYLAAVSPEGKPADTAMNLPSGEYIWEPEKSPKGPVSVLLSAADRMVYIYRNGVLIGRAGLTIVAPSMPIGSGVYTLLEGHADGPNEFVPGKPNLRWMAVSLPSKNGKESEPEIIDRVRMSPRFARILYDAMTPGTTLMVTDVAATPETRTGPGFTVLADDAAE